MNPRILVLDNYDSFTYNLVQLVREAGYTRNMDVHRNDKIDLSEIETYDKILLSPGPGLPKDAGIMPELIDMFGASKSILGICLGHQAIAESFGAELYNMEEVLHGVCETAIIQQKDYLFDDIPGSFDVCRYHSWSVVPQSLNGNMEIIAKDRRGEVMGIRHREYDVRGLQFHPESIMTEYGKEIITNWLNHWKGNN